MGFADELFADVVDMKYDAFGKAATYTAAGSDQAIPCVVVFDGRDLNARAEDGRPLVGQRTICIRKSEIVEPKYGAIIAVLGQTLTVMNKPLQPDPHGYEWRMWVE